MAERCAYEVRLAEGKKKRKEMLIFPALKVATCRKDGTLDFQQKETKEKVRKMG